MATLQIKRRTPEPEVHRSIDTLFVYDIRRGSELTPFSLPDSKSVQIAPGLYGSGTLVVHGDVLTPANVNESKTLFVCRVEDDNHIRYDRSSIQVISVEKSEGLFVPPADEDRVELEAGESVQLTNIELDLAVSYDTYFDFKLRSIDGLRVVMDENGKAVQADYDSYRLRNLTPGESTRRTIRTNNDFIVTLNVDPTIVKDRQT